MKTLALVALCFTTTLAHAEPMVNYVSSSKTMDYSKSGKSPASLCKEDLREAVVRACLQQHGSLSGVSIQITSALVTDHVAGMAVIDCQSVINADCE